MEGHGWAGCAVVNIKPTHLRLIPEEEVMSCWDHPFQDLCLISVDIKGLFVVGQLHRCHQQYINEAAFSFNVFLPFLPDLFFWNHCIGNQWQVLCSGFLALLSQPKIGKREKKDKSLKRHLAGKTKLTHVLFFKKSHKPFCGRSLGSHYSPGTSLNCSCKQCASLWI